MTHNTPEKVSLKEVENIVRTDTDLTYEEYATKSQPMLGVILRDFAYHAIEKAREQGREMSQEEAMELAKREIPIDGVPEIVKNFRVACNLSVMQMSMMEKIHEKLCYLVEDFETAFGDKIDAGINELAKAMHAVRADTEGGGADGD